MTILPNVRRSKRRLHAKLFLVMLLFAAILLTTIFTGLFFIGSFSSTRGDIYRTLEIQLENLEQDVANRFETLAVLGVQLSEDMSEIIDGCLNARQITFDALKNSQDNLNSIQSNMFMPLKQKLLQAGCSGVFVMLDTTVNETLENAQSSRSGIYIQTNGAYSDAQLLLYRGNSQISKQYGIMPHRKWGLEFNTQNFPNYDEILASSNLPLEKAYMITDFFTLPSTCEKAVLLTLPIIGEYGTFYGICGFEINQSYFKEHYAQPTKLKHLFCVLANNENGSINSRQSLNCGVSGGYYLEPSEPLAYDPAKSGLLAFSGDELSYIGVKKHISLSCHDQDMLLAVMIPMYDYTNAVSNNIVPIVLFVIFLLFFAVICCLFFSHKFLSPVLEGLKRLKEQSPADHDRTNVPEIDDLFDFLAEKDRKHEEEIRLLETRKKEAEDEAAKAQTTVSRLVDKKTDEIDPDSFSMFLENLHTLTPREQEIFNLYLEGKTAKEIHIIIGASENTVKFHNKNIYSKLGVSSRKQLLQYATLMKQQQEKNS